MNTENNKHELLIAPNYTFIKAHLKNEFNRINLNGNNILVLGPIPNASNEYVNNTYKDSLYYRELKTYFQNNICDGTNFYDLKDLQIVNNQNINDESFRHSVIISSAYDMFLNEDIIKNNKAWFENLGLVVFENITGFVSYNRIWSSILSELLINYCQCKVIFLANEKQKLRDMVATEFNLQPDTTEDYMNSAKNFLYFTAWNRENESIINKVIQRSTHFVSMEVLIMAMAQKQEVSDNYYINYSTLPYINHLEEIEEAYPNIRNQLTQHLIQFQTDHNNRFIVSDDLYNNISYLLYSHKVPNEKKMFLNICSKPYLFRDYMAQNILYFNQYTLKPFAPEVIRNDEKNSLLTLYEILRRFDNNEKGYSEDQIRAFLKLNKNEDVFSYLVDKYKTFFDRDITHYLIENKFTEPQSFWKQKSYFKIQSNANFWLDKKTVLFEVVDNDNKLHVVYDYVPKDIVEQLFFAFPFFNYNQINYKLKKIDYNNQKIYIDSNTVDVEERVFASKVINEISLTEKEGNTLKTFIANENSRDRGLTKVLKYYTFEEITVKSLKRYDFKGSRNFDYAETEITYRKNEQSKFGKHQSRIYKNKKTLLFFLDGLNSKHSKVANIWNKHKDILSDISQTLVYLLKEALVSFLPQSYQFIDVIPIVTHATPASKNDEDIELISKVDRKLTPACSENDTIDLISKVKNNTAIDSGICIVFIEDAIQDLGLLAAIETNFNGTILRTIDDYLHWYITHYMQEKAPDNDVETEEHPTDKAKINNANLFENNFWEGALSKGIYNLKIDEVEFLGSPLTPSDIAYNFKTDFLRNVYQQHAEFLKIDALKEILRFYLDENHMTKDRIEFQKSKEKILYPPSDKNGEEIHQCDFCAKEYKLKDMKIIKDGRERCPKCSETALDKKEQYDNVFDKHVKIFFDAMNQKQPQDNLDVYITYADILNQPFHPTPYFDARVLGWAQQRGDEYKILAENGAPEKRAILTIIHEWVHIWQYVNIDYKKLIKDYDLHFVEGHTTWCEIYYASQIQKWDTQEYWENQLAPLSRKDEYGDGYRLVKKILKESGYQNPFVFLLKNYPKR